MMRAANSLLMRTSRMGIRKGLAGAGAKIVQQGQQYRFAQEVSHMRKTSTLQSMREFFMHPLTWDRNNGYLNVVLALAIFSFCFINSCASCPEEGPQAGPQTKKTEQ